MAKHAEYKDAVELKRHWDWSRVFETWKDRFSDFRSLHDLEFRKIAVCDPANPTGRHTEYSWWPSADLRELHLRLQRFLDDMPGSVGPIHPPVHPSKGQLETLQFLSLTRRSAELTAAVLISASLFSRMDSSRRYVPREKFPPWNCMLHLQELVANRLCQNDIHVGWHYSCTDVLPYAEDDHSASVIEGISGLIRYLAEEHAALLHQYNPIEITFVDEADPFLARVLREEREEERRLELQRAELVAKRMAEDRIAQAERLRKHPRHKDWPGLSKSELEQLVWTMPTSQLASIFGVSDVAVGKRCKALDVTKPPKGFWRKVETGLLPNPEGKPVAVKKRDGGN